MITYVFYLNRKQRIYSKRTSVWYCYPVKEVKRYPHIPQLMVEIVRKRLLDHIGMNRVMPLEPDDPPTAVKYIGTYSTTTNWKNCHRAEVKISVRDLCIGNRWLAAFMKFDVVLKFSEGYLPFSNWNAAGFFFHSWHNTICTCMCNVIFLVLNLLNTNVYIYLVFNLYDNGLKYIMHCL